MTKKNKNSIIDWYRLSRNFNKCKAFKEKADLIRSLKGYVQANDKVLVKGSRGMKLEEVVEALI